MDDTILPNGTNDLLCAVCFAKEEKEEGAIGICKVCKYYMCGPCTIAHQHHPDTRRHQMAFFYCSQKLKANRYVRADSFCLDCGRYLCTKCVLDHGGFWQYRHHTFIGQRSQTLTEIPLHYKQSPSPKANRRPLTKSTQRSNENEGRKSPYSLPDIIPKQQENVRRPKERFRIPENKFTMPKTLVHSSVGRKADTRDNLLRDTNKMKSKRPKSVHYKDEMQVSQAAMLGEYSVKSSEDTKPCKIVASVYLSNDSLVLADQANKNIKLFNKQCQCTSTMPLEHLPIAVCSSHLGPSQMFASSGSNVFNLNTESSGFQINASFDTKISKIEGITSWTDGIAAILRSIRSRADTKGHWEVHLMNYEGILKYVIAVSTPLKVKLVTPIWYISCSDTGREIFISDTHNNRILCIDIVDWHVVFVIKGKDNGGAPRSIATDATGNVLVTWYDGIHTISRSGADLGIPVPNVGADSVIAYNTKTMKLAVWSDNKTHADKFSLYQMQR